MTELSAREAQIVARFEAAEPAPESYIAPSVDQCRSSSHGADGWRCEHRDSHNGGHRNGDVTW